MPNVVGMQLEEAEKKMSKAGLQLVVQDTNYVRTMPPDCVLEQSPGQGKRIKSTHIVYVTINAANPPALVMPDLADNSSYREARATLLAMGFKTVRERRTGSMPSSSMADAWRWENESLPTQQLSYR